MNIREVLLKEHSKRQTDAVIQYVGNNQQRFDSLFMLLTTDESLVVQRAAWPVSYCVEAYPRLINKHMKTVIKLLNNPCHDAVKRNLLRFLKDIAVEEKYMSEIADISFAYLRAADEPAAIRVFAMRTLANICGTYPELSNELVLIIEDMLPHGQPSIRAAGKQVLKELKKMYF